MTNRMIIIKLVQIIYIPYACLTILFSEKEVGAIMFSF
jgi:hypothetical protein